MVIVPRLIGGNITDVQSIGKGLKTNNTLKELHPDDNNINMYKVLVKD